MKNRMRLNVENLKNSIAEKRIKKIDLALDIGVTRETLSRWLAGRIEYIDEGKLIKLSEILGCELSWLSPEIPVSRMKPMPPFNPSHIIRGDDFIRMGLYSGLWKDIANLYSQSRYPEIIQDSDANVQLFQALGSLVNLEFTEIGKGNVEADPVQRNHELFDVIARYSLIEGIQQMIAGDVNEAHRKFKRVIIQGQTEWLVALAYLMSGLCHGVLSSLQGAGETLDKGLAIFANSHDDLTMFTLANIHLLLCLLKAQENRPMATLHLQKARKLFDATGYRYGHLRCLSYESLLLSFQDKASESMAKADEVISNVRRMPRLYQLEALMNCGQATMRIGDRDASLQYIEMADELAKNSNLLSYLTKTQRLKLSPSDENLQDQVLKLKEKFEAIGQDHKWRRVL